MLARLKKVYVPSNVVKSCLVGLVATAGDLGLLNLLVRVCGLSPQAANIPSLMVGSTIQFLGNRTFVFQATGHDLGKHALRFFSVEATAFCLNALFYHLMVTFTSIPFTYARMLSSFILFLGFSFPLWTRVFRKPLDVGR